MLKAAASIMNALVFTRLRKQALDIFNQRYAGGEITREPFARMKSDIAQTA